MSNVPAKIVSGSGEPLPTPVRNVIISLMGLFKEEVCKTALLYAIHNSRVIVTNDDVLMAIKYELLSPNGCGLKLKQSVMEVWNEKQDHDQEMNPESQQFMQQALDKYYSLCNGSSSVSGAVTAITDTIVPQEMRRAQNEPFQHGAQNEPFQHGAQNEPCNHGAQNEPCNHGVKRRREDGDDDGSHNDNGSSDDGSDDDGNDDDGTSNEESVSECSCETCLEIRHLFTSDHTPTDTFESHMCAAFKKASKY